MQLGQRVKLDYDWAGDGTVVGLDGTVVRIVFDNGRKHQSTTHTMTDHPHWYIVNRVASVDEILDAYQLGEETEKRERENKELQKQVDQEEKARLEVEYAHLIRKTERNSWSGARLVASNIRRELKQAFPGVKFSVISGSRSVRVKWVGGPTCDEVSPIVKKYELGYFDGMQDMYVHQPSVFSSVFGGVLYVFLENFDA